MELQNNPEPVRHLLRSQPGSQLHPNILPVSGTDVRLLRDVRKPTVINKKPSEIVGAGVINGRCLKHRSAILRHDKATQTLRRPAPGSAGGGGGDRRGQIDKSPGVRSVKHLLPCMASSAGAEEREGDREARLGQVDWGLYTSLFLRDDEEARSGLYHANFADNQMDELNLEKAYSIEYYKRMFYPEVPCKQCEHCWRQGY